MFHVQLLLFVSNYEDLFPRKKNGELLNLFRLFKNVGVQIRMENIYICNFYIIFFNNDFFYL